MSDNLGDWSPAADNGRTKHRAANAKMKSYTPSYAIIVKNKIEQPPVELGVYLSQLLNSSKS